MSDSILSGDITVYYSADNNRKQIKWTGSATGTRSVREVYSALQDLFDELAQMDDGIPMSAQTPTEYTIGAIDASDTIPWFIDDETIQHLNGGAIQTKKWTRTATVQPGIVKLTTTVSSSAIVYADIGNTITASAGSTSTGVLLDIQVVSGTAAAGTVNYYIRPTDASTTHNWVGTTSFSCNSHASGAGLTTIVTTGEELWANIYSLGSLPTDIGKNQISDLFVYRDSRKVQRYTQSTGVLAYQWWPTGHIDILMKVKSMGGTYFPSTAATISGTTTVTLSAGNTMKLRVGDYLYGNGGTGAVATGAKIAAITGINTFTMDTAGTNGTVNIWANSVDGSYVTVEAREFDNTYDYFTVDLYNGGRNPIPLATSGDLNNTVGIRKITQSAGNGTSFQVGEIIYTGASLAAATAKGVVTKVTGSGTSQVIRYYLIGDLTDLTSTDIKGAVSTATVTASTLADNDDVDTGAVIVNPKSFTGTNFGITYATTGTPLSDDLNNSNGTKYYGIKINPGSNKYSLAKMYEWTKYVARRGSTDTANFPTRTADETSGGATGEKYLGAETILKYTSAAGGSYTAGTIIYQANTKAFGIVIAHDNTSATFKYVLLRNVRGTFDATVVTDGTTSVTPTSVDTFNTVKACPFGSFAGGKFFAAPGVMFERGNLAAGDDQAFQLTALDGSTQIPPNTITVKVDNLVSGDSVGIFPCRQVAGVADKASYTMPASSIGGTSVAVTAGTRTVSPVAGDEPDGATLGFIRVVKDMTGGITQEHRYRYSALAATTNTFTLQSIATGQGGALTATAAQYWNSMTNAVATGGNLYRVTLGTAIATTRAVGEVNEGDMVFTGNSGGTTRVGYGVVVKIEDSTHIWVRALYGSGGSNAPALADWSTATNYVHFNKFVTAYTTADKVYVPIIDSYIYSGTSIQNKLIYSTAIPLLVRVRQYKSIVPFEQAPSLTGGTTFSTIRTADSIAT